MDPLILVLALALLVEIIWTVRAAHGLSLLYGSRRFDSEFFRRLVARNKRVAYIGGGLIAVVVVLTLLAIALPGLPRLPSPWPIVLVALGLMVLLSGPILDERYVRSVRNGGDPNVKEEL